MSDFQLIMSPAQTGNGSRLILFNIVSSYLRGATLLFNVTGVDEENNNYIGIMVRSPRGEFIVTNLKKV